MPEPEEHVITSVRVPRRIWEALQALSHAQSIETGRSVSASKVVAQLIQAAADKRDFVRG